MHLLLWILLFGDSIASSWLPLSRVSALYWYNKITVSRFVSDSLVFTQYSNYCDFFCSRPSLRLRNHSCHGWFRYIDTMKLRFCVFHRCYCLLIYDDYVILFYFILNWCNGAIVKWYNGKKKIRSGHFVSHRYRIYAFFLSNTTFLQQTKKSIIFNLWTQTTSTATKFMLSNQATTEIRGSVRDQPIFVR